MSLRFMSYDNWFADILRMAQSARAYHQPESNFPIFLGFSFCLPPQKKCFITRLASITVFTFTIFRKTCLCRESPRFAYQKVSERKAELMHGKSSIIYSNWIQDSWEMRVYMQRAILGCSERSEIVSRENFEFVLFWEANFFNLFFPFTTFLLSVRRYAMYRLYEQCIILWFTLKRNRKQKKFRELSRELFLLMFFSPPLVQSKVAEVLRVRDEMLRC